MSHSDDNGLNLLTVHKPPKLNVFLYKSCCGHGWCLFTATETLKTEVGSTDRGITMIDLTVLLFEVLWILQLWIRKAVECFKCCLVGHPSRNIEDSGPGCGSRGYRREEY